MKKIWKTRTEEGVSPVIATILMVAITVVLAAVLYVMVIGMVPNVDGTTPVGALTMEVQSSTSVTIIFGKFQPEPEPMFIKVRITNNSDIADVIVLSFTNAPNAGTVDMVATGVASATYTDLNYQGNKINSGDFIIVDGLSPHTSYTVSIYHAPTESLCQIAGATDFNLP